MPAALSYHKLALSPIISGLKNAYVFIQKSQAHVLAEDHDPTAYISARLFPDMLDFASQVHRFAEAAKDIPNYVNPSNPNLDIDGAGKTFEEVLEQIEKTIAFLESIDESTFEKREEEATELILGGGTIRAKFTTLEYVMSYAHPNFW